MGDLSGLLGVSANAEVATTLVRGVIRFFMPPYTCANNEGNSISKSQSDSVVRELRRR